MGEPEPKPQLVLPEWVRKHGTSILVTVIGGVIVGLILYFVLGTGGGSSTQVVVGGTAASEEPAEPENFSEAVAQRPFWTTPPYLTEEADPDREAGGPPFSNETLDVAVTQLKALVESPGYHESGSVIVIAKAVEQQEVSGKFIEQEIRMESAKPYYDLYVVPSQYDLVTTGLPTFIEGRLAAVGYTQDPSGHRHRTAYIDARHGHVEGIFGPEGIGSAAIRKAYKELADAQQG